MLMRCANVSDSRTLYRLDRETSDKLINYPMIAAAELSTNYQWHDRSRYEIRTWSLRHLRSKGSGSFSFLHHDQIFIPLLHSELSGITNRRLASVFSLEDSFHDCSRSNEAPIRPYGYNVK